MCGIVGYIGDQDAKEILLKGLEKLEYRGYDSAGIAVVPTGCSDIQVYKEKGKIRDIRRVVDTSVSTTCGIGHTRWATHGKPTKENAHPHTSEHGRFALVHNGIIENDRELKHTYLPHVAFQSDTDTEVIVQLMEHFAQTLPTEEAFVKTLNLLEGSYAIALIDQTLPDQMLVAKHKTPMLIGIGDGAHMIASDGMALLHVTNQMLELQDREYAVLTRDDVTLYNEKGQRIERPCFTSSIQAADIEKGGYPHYMLKEIDEQAYVLRTILGTYTNQNGELCVDSFIQQQIQQAERIYIVACGTSYHAGLVAKTYFEKWAKIPTEVHVASEFGYYMPLLSPKACFLFISQSGETADVRNVLQKVKNMGYPAITITNSKGSTLTRESDATMLLHAGPEISVASTKAYTAQITVLSILAYAASKEKPDWDLQRELSTVANGIEYVTNQKQTIERLASEYLQVTRNAFFIGRGLDYAVSLEGALKLKEISYIQAEGFAGGELKHGTISLIEERTPVIVTVTQSASRSMIRSNEKEVASRGAHTCIISMEGLAEEGDAFILPRVEEDLAPLVSVVVTQLLSYYAALERGCDIDQPKNLSKAVSVE